MSTTHTRTTTRTPAALQHGPTHRYHVELELWGEYLEGHTPGDEDGELEGEYTVYTADGQRYCVQGWAVDMVTCTPVLSAEDERQAAEMAAAGLY